MYNSSCPHSHVPVVDYQGIALDKKVVVILYTTKCQLEATTRGVLLILKLIKHSLLLLNVREFDLS